MERKIEVFTPQTKERMSLAKDIALDFGRAWNFSHPNQGIGKYFQLFIIPKEIKKLGFYSPKDDTIALSEAIFGESFDYQDVKEIIGHEVAHRIAHKVFNSSGHDPYFRQVCRDLGVNNDKSIFKHYEDQIVSNNKYLEKIKKLLALSESDFSAESNSALLKARQLMHENNISTVTDQGDKVYRVCLTKFKAYTQELSALSLVVKLITGCWLLISGDTGEYKKLYAHGTKSEVEIAEYLFDFLKREFEQEYTKFASKRYRKSGLKKSFYIGLKSSLRTRFSKDDKESNRREGLIPFEEINEKLSKELIYIDTKIVSKSSTITINNPYAYSAGKQSANNIRIYSGVKNSNNSQKYLS
jgi:hypothetical protein